MDDEIYMSEAELEQVKRARDTRRRFLDDLAETASHPQGQRLLLALMTRLGLGRAVSGDAGAIALRNFGEELARDLGEASPEAATNILKALYGLNG